MVNDTKKLEKRKEGPNNFLVKKLYWVKFERLDGKDGFNTRIDNAYQQFRNIKEMTQDEIDKAEWMKARNKLDSPAFVQKLIHQGKSVDELMKVAGYTRERFEKQNEKAQTATPDGVDPPSLTQAQTQSAAPKKSKAKSKAREQDSIPF